MTEARPSPLPAEWFDKADPEPDTAFYEHPRLVQHIDEGAIAAVTVAIARHVAPASDVLDLMSSWVSHMPPAEALPLGRVSGLGMNAAELAANPRLGDWTIKDLNVDPSLPYTDASFDAVLITVSVQYLTRPVDVMTEIARVLRPGGVLLISFSNRMFATKAVAVWQAASEEERPRVVAAYLRAAGGFMDPTVEEHRPPRTWLGGGDPLWVVVARRPGGATDEISRPGPMTGRAGRDINNETGRGSIPGPSRCRRAVAPDERRFDAGRR